MKGKQRSGIRSNEEEVGKIIGKLKRNFKVVRKKMKWASKQEGNKKYYHLQNLLL